MAAVGAGATLGRPVLVLVVLLSDRDSRGPHWARPPASQGPVIVAITNPSILIGTRVIAVPVPATHGVWALVRAKGSLDLKAALLEQSLICDLTTVVAAGRKINVARRACDRRHARSGFAAHP